MTLTSYVKTNQFVFDFDNKQTSFRVNMKPLTLLLVIFYVLSVRSLSTNNCYEDRLKNNHAVKTFNKVGTLIKVFNASFTKKEFYKQLQRKRRSVNNNIRTSRYTILLRLLLLCNGVEANPGPTSVKCQTCHQLFNRASRLANHQASASPSPCDICGVVYCHESRKQQHILREHSGYGINTTTSPESIDLNVPILGNTSYQDREGYRNMCDEHGSSIRTHTMEGRYWKKFNKEIPAGFTYGDLKRMLEDIQTNEVGAFKINLGFGSILYVTVGQIFRYFYVSHNHYLYDRAFTISNHTDMMNFFNKIVSLDIMNRYYFQRPSSGWVLAGLPNIEIKIMRIPNVPIGAGVELPAHIKRSRSIISLTHHEQRGYAYNDNLCLFRCLGLQFGADIGGLEETAAIYKNKLEEATGESYVEGVDLEKTGRC